jgi:hypothetical protein
VDEGFSMQRNEFLLLTAPLGGKFMPIIMLVIAPHKHSLRHWHVGDPLPAFGWRKHPSATGFEIDDVTNASENVRLVSFNRLLQIVQQFSDTVNV